jgi:hypothetical protein
MRLHGRLTVFGEYLMHGSSWGLIVPTNLCLGGEDEAELPAHANYSSELDGTAALLRSWGYECKSEIRGNLPLGAGLAGSSILARLHLEKLPPGEVKSVVDRLDREIHGFEPSGVDSTFALRQEAGLYRQGQWSSVRGVPLYSLALLRFPKEGSGTLPAVKRLIDENRTRLASMAGQLAEAVRSRGALDLEALWKYAAELQGLGVYGPRVGDFIRQVLASGLIAKGVGGLRDKAVMVMGENIAAVEEAVELGRAYGAALFGLWAA